MKRSMRLAGVLAAIGLAGALTVAGSGVARASVTPPASGGWAEIFNPYLRAQGFPLCADEPNGSSAQFLKIDLFHCHGYASNGAPQRWAFVPDGTSGIFGNFPVYHIENLHSGLCLGLSTADVSNTAGRDVDQQTCASLDTDWILRAIDPTGPNPDFQLEALVGFPFINTWCLAASNFTGNNNTRLVNEPCSPTDTRQLFNLG
jgi:hypothetical protein